MCEPHRNLSAGSPLLIENCKSMGFCTMESDEKNLRAVSEKLQRVTIVCGDYRKSADFIDENTFVYFDPPYRPITDTASFTAYTENLFNDDAQIELAQFVDEMDKKGAKIVVKKEDSYDFFRNN